MSRSALDTNTINNNTYFQKRGVSSIIKNSIFMTDPILLILILYNSFGMPAHEAC